MSTLDAVLDRIDRDIDQSLDRLFELLRIASISTDPAFADQCRAAVRHGLSRREAGPGRGDVRFAAGCAYGSRARDSWKNTRYVR